MLSLPALPARPLHARPPAARSAQAFALMAWLFCVGMLVFTVAFVGPDLLADWQVRDTAVEVTNGRLSKGRCHGKLFVYFCDATLTAPDPAGGPRIQRSVDFAFASLTLGNFEAMVVADPRRPELLTTDLALDHFWDRVVTLLVGVGILGALSIYGIIRHLHTRRDTALWRTSPSMPVPLRLQDATRSRSGVAWTVQDQDGNAAHWTLPHRSQPFTLDGEGWVFGLRRQVDGAIMPLDAGLRWLDLSDAERATALASGTNPAAAAA